MTVDEFLTLPDVEGQRLELVQGGIVDAPRGGPAHEFVKSNLLLICLRYF
jgi:hypothetical protein